MPIREYFCHTCNIVLEELILSKNEELNLCPNCNSKLTTKISASNPHFKGSGWYVSDYKNQKEKAEKKEKNNDKKQSIKNKETIQ